MASCSGVVHILLLVWLVQHCSACQALLLDGVCWVLHCRLPTVCIIWTCLLWYQLVQLVPYGALTVWGGVLVVWRHSCVGSSAPPAPGTCCAWA
jgi:hypothetical protein